MNVDALRHRLYRALLSELGRRKDDLPHCLYCGKLVEVGVVCSEHGDLPRLEWQP